MRTLRIVIATCLVSGLLVVVAPAAGACQGEDGRPCPGAAECYMINDLARKVYKDQLMACPT